MAKLPLLPPEIWVMIFSFHDNLPHLWLCRHVSTEFRAHIELVFRSRYLPQVAIGFYHQCSHPLDCDGDQMATLRMHFKAVSDDDQRAFFKPSSLVKEKDFKISTPRDFLLNAAQNIGFYNLRSVKRLPRIVAFGTYVSDTSLPRLEFDPSANEASFNWRGMFNDLLKEERLMEQRLELWIPKIVSQMEQGFDMIHKGTETYEGLTAWLSIMAHISWNASRRDIRRVRIDNKSSPWLAPKMEKSGSEYDLLVSYLEGSEDSILEQLAVVRFNEAWPEDPDDESYICEFNGDLDSMPSADVELRDEYDSDVKDSDEDDHDEYERDEEAMDAELDSYIVARPRALIVPEEPQPPFLSAGMSYQTKIGLINSEDKDLIDTRGLLRRSRPQGEEPPFQDFDDYRSITLHRDNVADAARLFWHLVPTVVPRQTLRGSRWSQNRRQR
ncbi:MAG: hypothetical protein M1820_006494 [Bogoriella megaspora]|nr:MAG: hypothetical protein M1820_006494 [Bogoriella megaspora]